MEDLEESLDDPDVRSKSMRSSNVFAQFKPQNGVLPPLLKVLASHSDLAQQSSDAQIRKAALDHLRELRDSLQETLSLEREGRLPEAVAKLSVVKGLLESSPEPLPRSAVVGEAKVLVAQCYHSVDLTKPLQRRFRALEISFQEQIGVAYDELVSINTSLQIQESFSGKYHTNSQQERN